MSTESDLQELKWTVVEFAKEFDECKEVSVVPINWIFNTNDQNMCFWPKAKIRKNIQKRTLPVKDEWEIWPINILLKDAVSYQEALKFEKQKAKETETEEDTGLNNNTNGRPKRKRKVKRNEDYVTGSSEENYSSIPPPPKILLISNAENTEKEHSWSSMDTLSVTSGELMPPPPPRSFVIGPCSQRDEEILQEEQESEGIPLLNLHNAEFIYEDINPTPMNNGTPISDTTENQLNQRLHSILQYCASNKILLERILKQLENFSGTQQANSEARNFDSVPKKQFQKFKYLLKYDKNLEESLEHQKELQTAFCFCGGSNEGENIKRGLNKIFSDKLATKCSWLGRKGNFQVSNLKLIEILKVAVRRNFSKLTDKNFETIVANWFRGSNLRYIRKQEKRE